jgi:hypothetical protein
MKGLLLKNTSIGAYHVCESENSSSMLTRYGILNSVDTECKEGGKAALSENGVTLKADRNIEFDIKKFSPLGRIFYHLITY